MNLKEYISSGIVESYVLGLAEPSEREEFERLCAAHPEVREARENFERSLEEFAGFDTLSPPKNLKSRILAAIDAEAGGKVFEEAAQPFKQTPVLRSEPAKIRSLSGWQRFIAVASIALLLISTALNFYFFNKYREYDKRYEALVFSQSQLASHNQVLQTRLLESERAMGLMKDPNMAVVKMSATPNSPDPSSATMIFWNTISKDVYLAVNQLPAPSADQQYQLWALVDGVPVDAGVFDIGQNPGVVRMKNIPRAQAFAITLEKKGGSAKPTMDKLYVLGKV